MEQYRLRYAPSRNCGSCDVLDAVLEQALLKVDEGSEKIFEELESRQETLFFSRKGLEPTLKNITNITKLITCDCNVCKDHRPVGLDVLAPVTRLFDEEWLILGMLILLGKLYSLHSWLSSERGISNLNLDAAMTHPVETISLIWFIPALLLRKTNHSIIYYQTNLPPSNPRPPMLIAVPSPYPTSMNIAI